MDNNYEKIWEAYIAENVPAPAAEPAAPKVSMTTIQQAPEVLKALATLFSNPTILTLVKAEIAKAGKPAAQPAAQPAAEQPGSQPNPTDLPTYDFE